MCVLEASWILAEDAVKIKPPGINLSEIYILMDRRLLRTFPNIILRRAAMMWMLWVPIWGQPRRKGEKYTERENLRKRRKHYLLQSSSEWFSHLSSPVILRNTNVFWGEDDGADVLTFLWSCFPTKGRFKNIYSLFPKTSLLKQMEMNALGLKHLEIIIYPWSLSKWRIVICKT